ncbi:MAG: hypothetical protein WA632_07570 [Gallionella sp.]
MFSVTKNLCAAMHLGDLDPQHVIGRLEDRHKAVLPELGVDKELLLSEARVARRRNVFFRLALFIPIIWAISIPIKYEIYARGYQLADYLFLFIYPLLAVAAILVIKSAVVCHHLCRIVKSTPENTGEQDRQNVIIFGDFSPFAGYGYDRDGWSFTIDATKPMEDGGTAQSFGQREFLDYIASALRKNVPQVSIQDILFVSGRKIRNNRMLLPNVKATPVSLVEKGFIDGMIGNPDLDMRHYRVISIPLAEGHIFQSFFLRSTMLGGNLFFESRSFILPPILERFSRLVHLPEWTGTTYYLRLFVKGLLFSPVIWISGPTEVLTLIGKLQATIVTALFGHPEDKAKIRDETYNYGHRASLRQEFSSNNFQTYFQMLDRDMAEKTCQHIIVNSMVDFLSARGIATDDIKERRTQIFNSGVIVSGGTVNAQQLAVGAGASVRSKIASKLKRANK